MNIEPGRIINDFIEPNKVQYAIPVYQRNYEWSREQCEKLFADIVKAYKVDKPHFCGSVVYAPLKEEHNIHYYVIVDGQQRLTTIYLLLKALVDKAETPGQKEPLLESLYNKDKYDTYDVDTSSKLKLKPVKTDNLQLCSLMDNKLELVDKSSGIWINYEIFCELIEKALQEDSELDVRKIYRGMEKLTCAKIRLDADDNAQEIFERINSTGVQLSLADKIRNYVLMTDADQEKLYEDYWLKMETMLHRNQMSEFFLDYLNMKMDSFAKESTAYEDFKRLFEREKYTNEGILEELLHYAEYYHAFMEGDSKYSEKINKYLAGLRQLKQTTVFLFLFHVFDDLDAENDSIDQETVEKVLQLLQNYSIRRIMCEISSNSLRGLYKTMYGRVFANEENKKHYYDAIVSFLIQLSSRDAIPRDDDFKYALKNYNLYRKHALCRFILLGIENQGKEQVVADALTIEHVLPQNKNGLSDEWQEMLGEDWAAIKECWQDTLGNLTLTGYNSELGDRPFDVKKQLIREQKTKVVNLYQDILDKDVWNEETIKKRADRLVKEIMRLFPIPWPKEHVSYKDSSYTEYTCADPENATFKSVSYYEILGERVNVDSFAEMVRSAARKLYDLDSDIIERMARTGETIDGWSVPVFSYDKNQVHGETKLAGTELYIYSGMSARDCISLIKGLLLKYELNIEEDFIYSAKRSGGKTKEDTAIE